MSNQKDLRAKYVFWLRIGVNAGDVLSLPCVRSCEKVAVSHADVVCTYEWSYELFDGSVAHAGDWIVRDIWGEYHVMSDGEYQSHIHDKV